MSQSKIFFSARTDNLPPVLEKKIDWEKCLFCQEDKSEKLTDPGKNSRGNAREGYDSVSKRLLEFDRLGKVPFNLDVKKLNCGDGLSKTLSVNSAKWHHLCYSECSTSRLNREVARQIKIEKENLAPAGAREASSQHHDEALAHIIAHMNEVRMNSTGAMPVFHLRDIASMYEKYLRQRNFDFKVHSTRLKDRIVAACPYLEANGSQGKEIIFSFKRDVDEAIRRLSSASINDDEMGDLRRAAKILRRDMLNHGPTLWQDMSVESQEKSSPKSLKVFLQLLLDGRQSDETEQHTDREVLTLSQLVQFNTVQRKRGKGQARRHDREKEAPLPVYLAMKLYAEARGKGPVKYFSRLGLCIGYDRLRAILRDMKNRNLKHFEEIGVVCPPGLVHGLFTSTQLDNIDHNTSSTTASDAFHGTAITLVQHPPPGVQSKLPTFSSHCTARTGRCGKAPETRGAGRARGRSEAPD